MAEVKHSSLIKPALETPFHIDFSWWRQNDQEWSVYLRSLLGSEYEGALAEIKGDEQLDWVDPQSAEVKRVDAIQFLLITHFAIDNDLLEEGSSLVESIFRVFLKNGNTPLTSDIAIIGKKRINNKKRAKKIPSDPTNVQIST